MLSTPSQGFLAEAQVCARASSGELLCNLHAHIMLQHTRCGGHRGTAVDLPGVPVPTATTFPQPVMHNIAAPVGCTAVDAASPQQQAHRQSRPGIESSGIGNQCLMQQDNPPHGVTLVLAPETCWRRSPRRSMCGIFDSLQAFLHEALWRIEGSTKVPGERLWVHPQQTVAVRPAHLAANNTWKSLRNT
jgi:hypothetical protein